MNKFATLKQEIQFRKVTYYSVCLGDSTQSLFLNFLNEHAGSECEEELAMIRSWLKKLGNEIGAQSRYFRPEERAHALPPPAQFLKISCSLRLYCVRISDQAVVLFGGAVKTAAKAQDCSQVGPHFRLAIKLTEAIDDAIKHRDIKSCPETGRLLFSNDLILDYE